MNLLYDGPHIQVLERPGSSRYALVTFAEMGMRADGASIWAQTLVETLDLHAVGFVAKAPNWYPLADLARACAAAAPALARFDERIGYGFSQGGYAAIKASRPLALTQTIAVSPQASIDPADVADQRFRRFFAPDLHAGMRVVTADAPRSLHLFHDRAHVDDREQADLIVAALPASNAHPMPFTDHDTIRVFARSTSFPALVDAVVAGTPAGIASRMRRDSLVRKAIMVQRAARAGRAARAFAVFDAVGFTGARRWLLLADLAEAGGGHRVLQLAQGDLGHRPDDPLGNAVFALALATLGRANEAKSHIAVARRGPTHGRVGGVVDRAERRLTLLKSSVDVTAGRGRAAGWSRGLGLRLPRRG